MNKIVVTVSLMAITAGCTHATSPATSQDGSGNIKLEELVGKRVTLTGVYGGPGKFAAGYIKLNDSQWVYLDKMSGLKPGYGQRIQATGVVRHNPGFTPPAHEPPIDGLPAHYYFESAAISAVPASDAATQPGEGLGLYIESWDRIAFESPSIVEGSVSKWHSKKQAEAVIAAYRGKRAPRAAVMLGKNLDIGAKTMEAEIDDIQNWLIGQGIMDITFRQARSKEMPAIVRECRNGKTVVPAGNSLE